MGDFDYIIVGAGSAGCVIANRLSENPGHRVLLIEAGPEDTNPFIRIPKGFGKLLSDPQHAWFFAIEPEPGNANKGEVWVRGKTLGGSSAVNGMVYMRGQPQDYDHWEALGCKGWGWSTLRSYFKQMEDHALGADELRGAGGPLGISPRAGTHRLAEGMIAAGGALGLARRDDLNREDTTGIGYLNCNIKRGVRQSSAEAFLKPIRRRPNLTVMTDTLVDKVLFDGKRAFGVLTRREGAAKEYRGREVILSAGALQSPKILQLSGIGPAQLLGQHEIRVVADSPGCGMNMRDHRLLFIQHRVREAGLSDNQSFAGLRLMTNMLRYYLFKSGVMATGSYDVGGFAKTRPELDRPDIQLMFAPYSLDFAAPELRFESFPGMQFFGYALRPESQGHVLIRSRDPNEPASIKPNWLTAEYDRRTSIEMVRYMRRLLDQEPMKHFLGEETTPGTVVRSDDEIIDAFARLGQSGYHACGTCKMGQDEMSVVDDRLHVRGVSGLRVADISIMPTVTSGNTNAPAMVIGARAADLILEDAGASTGKSTTAVSS
ncbi:MAG: GMC family oxidoreductase N-terminal domain-containing protein [Sinobacteraceae bacterium]|nr:GMC family oxidoreductase N-terminal domain-containing protein [Nevskiaceae bacterium]